LSQLCRIVVTKVQLLSDDLCPSLDSDYFPTDLTKIGNMSLKSYKVVAHIAIIKLVTIKEFQNAVFLVVYIIPKQIG